MLCTCIYFADIGSYDGEEMPPPPHDPVVDLDDIDAEDQQEASADDQRPAPAGAPARGQCMSDARYRMELGDQLNAFLVEAGIFPIYFTDIEADDRLLQMWRGMSRDMYSLMRHVVGVTTSFMQLTRTVACYKRVAAHDGQCARRSVPSTSHDCSQPHAVLD